MQQPMPEPPPQSVETAERAAPESRIDEAIHLARRVVQLIGDPRVPVGYKSIPALALLYVLSPIDLLPDTIPFVTQLDDLAIVIIAARLFVKLADRELTRRQADGTVVTTTYQVREDR